MEKFLSLFYFLLQFKLIEKLATIYYGLGNTLLIKLLKKKNLVSLYIKSDIKGLYFEIGVSDFDYVIVPSCQSELHYISRVYAVLNRFFPFIKDYDVYTEKQLQHLVRFGGIKFNRADSWVLLFGNEQRTSAYFYHPYKLFCDQMDEIYFYILWIFENRKKKVTRYRRKVLIRTLKKIFSMIRWIEDSKHDYKKIDLNWSDLEINLLDECDSLLFEKYWMLYLNERFQSEKYLKYFPANFKNLTKRYEVKRDKEWNVFDCGFYKFSEQIRKDSILLTNSAFILLYYSGSINSDTLTDIYELMRPSPLSILSKLRAINSKLLGCDNNQYLKAFSKEIDLLNSIEFSSKDYLDIIDNDFCVTVSWGDDPKRNMAFLRAQKHNMSQIGNFQSIHFTLNDENTLENNLNLLGINNIFIKAKKKQVTIWQKEALYNFASSFLFGSKKIIFLDSDVYSEDINWFSKILKKLDISDFVQGFSVVEDTVDQNYKDTSWTKKYLDGETSFSAQGLVWGIQTLFLNKINGLPDSCLDGSNDSLFLEELTGVSMGVSNSTSWYYEKVRRGNLASNIDYVDSEVIHINHGDARLYTNRVEIMNFFEREMSRLIEKNDLGLYYFIDQNNKKNNLLEVRNSFLSLSSPSNLESINDCFFPEEINFSNPVKLIVGDARQGELVLNGVICSFVEDKDEIEITIGIAKLINSITLKLNEDSLTLSEARVISYRVNTSGNTYKIHFEKNWMPINSIKSLSSKMFENINNKYDQFLLTCNSDNEALHTVIQFSNVKENQKIRILKNDVKYSSAVYNWREVIVLRSYFQMSNYEILFSIPDELQTGWWAFNIQFIDSIHFEFEVGVVFSDDLSYCCEPRTLNTKDQNIKTLYYKSIYSFGMGIVIKSDHSLAGLDRIKLTLYQVADLETNL